MEILASTWLPAATSMGPRNCRARKFRARWQIRQHRAPHIQSQRAEMFKLLSTTQTVEIRFHCRPEQLFLAFSVCQPKVAIAIIGSLSAPVRRTAHCRLKDSGLHLAMPELPRCRAVRL